jgi:hypothetical protein
VSSISIRNTTYALTTRELSAASGASDRQIQYWEEHGLLRCEKAALPGNASRRLFPASELPFARVLKKLSRFRKLRRGFVAAFRRNQLIPPFFVVTDPLGRRVRFAKTKAEVFAIAKQAAHAVVVVEVNKDDK